MLDKAEKPRGWLSSTSRLRMALVALLLVILLTASVGALLGRPRLATQRSQTATMTPAAAQPTQTATALPEPTNTSTPPLTDLTVYVVSQLDDSLLALQANSGKLLWSYKIGNTLSVLPAVANGVIYATQDDGSLIALRTSDRSLLWRSMSLGSDSSLSTAADGVLYFVSPLNGSLYAVRASDGSVLWRVTGKPQISAVTVANGVVYFGAGSVYAVRASDGSALWTFQGAMEAGSPPSVVQGVVYISGGDSFSGLSGVYALRASDGGLLWDYQVAGTPACHACGGGSPMYTGPLQSVVDGVVYAGSGGGVVYALRANTGALLWNYQPGGLFVTRPRVDQGMVYIGAEDGIHALRADNGNPVWVYRSPSGTLFEADQVVFGGFQQVFALDGTTGAVFWQYGGSIMAAWLIGIDSM